MLHSWSRIALLGFSVAFATTGAVCRLGFELADNGDCLHSVLFLPKPNPSLSKLKRELVDQKLLLASLAHVTVAARKFAFATTGFAMLDDGSFAMAQKGVVKPASIQMPR